MIAIPTQHKCEIEWNEAFNEVAINGDLLEGMEGIKKAYTDNPVTHWYSYDCFQVNAYNTIFKGMSKLF